MGSNISTIIEEDESSVEISYVSDGRDSAIEIIFDACEDEIQSREKTLDVFCGTLHLREGISSPESSEGSSSEEEAEFTRDPLGNKFMDTKKITELMKGPHTLLPEIPTARKGFSF